jgi:hypothetical protein
MSKVLPFTRRFYRIVEENGGFYILDRKGKYVCSYDPDYHFTPIRYGTRVQAEIATKNLRFGSQEEVSYDVPDEFERCFNTMFFVWIQWQAYILDDEGENKDVVCKKMLDPLFPKDIEMVPSG